MDLVDKYIQHAMKSDLIRGVARNDRRRMMTLPVCPRCERPMLRDRRKDDPDGRENLMATCPVCGYHGKSDKQMGVFVKEMRV